MDHKLQTKASKDQKTIFKLGWKAPRIPEVSLLSGPHRNPLNYLQVAEHASFPPSGFCACQSSPQNTPNTKVLLLGMYNIPDTLASPEIKNEKIYHLFLSGPQDIVREIDISTYKDYIFLPANICAIITPQKCNICIPIQFN